MDKQMLAKAKEELKELIIDEHSLSYYEEIIKGKVEWLSKLKRELDTKFNKKPHHTFREIVISQTIIANKETLDEEEQLYNIIITEIALDEMLKLNKV